MNDLHSDSRASAESSESVVNLDELEVAAIVSASGFMEAAECWIDQQFGRGYAEKHPALVAGFMQTSAIVFLAERVRRNDDA